MGGLRPVAEFPVDVSPFGVRACAGHVRTWCRNRWFASGTPHNGGRIPADAWQRGTSDLFELRGGAYHSTPQFCRPASRYGAPPGHHGTSAGIRLVRAV